MTINNEIDRQAVSNRLESFADFLKNKKIRLAEQPGFSKQARDNYRKKGTLPSAPILYFWSIMFDLDINWLLTGQGEMLRTNSSTNDAEVDALKAELAEMRERVSELKYTLDLQRRMLEQDGAFLEDIPARGRNNAAPSLRRGTDPPDKEKP